MVDMNLCSNNKRQNYKVEEISDSHVKISCGITDKLFYHGHVNGYGDYYSYVTTGETYYIYADFAYGCGTTSRKIHVASKTDWTGSCNSTSPCVGLWKTYAVPIGVSSGEAAAQALADMYFDIATVAVTAGLGELVVAGRIGNLVLNALDGEQVIEGLVEAAAVCKQGCTVEEFSTTFGANYLIGRFGGELVKKLGGVIYSLIKAKHLAKLGAAAEMADDGGVEASMKAILKNGYGADEVAGGLEKFIKKIIDDNDIPPNLESKLRADIEDAPHLVREFLGQGGTGKVKAWEKFLDDGLPPAFRRNVTNLKQRSLIDEYADNIANASNARKGNFGEIGADLDLNSKGYQSLQPRIDNIDAGGHNGLDGVYIKDGEYFIIEGKYTGSASLNPADPTTGLPRQMSDDWIASRDWDGINLDQGTLENLLQTKNYKRILAKVQPDGTVTYQYVGSTGYLTPNGPGSGGTGPFGEFIP